jgi:hypothetical protein
MWVPLPMCAKAAAGALGSEQRCEQGKAGHDVSSNLVDPEATRPDRAQVGLPMLAAAGCAGSGDASSSASCFQTWRAVATCATVPASIAAVALGSGRGQVNRVTLT